MANDDEFAPSTNPRRWSRLAGSSNQASRRQSTLRPGEDDMEEDEMIDPELRLRTVRTAGKSLLDSFRFLVEDLR